MGITALIGSPADSWRHWLRENLGSSDLLCLSPNEPNLGPPGQIALYRGEVPVWTRFYGSLDATRSPHVLVAALAEAQQHFRDGMVLFPSYRSSPVLAQTVRLLLRLLNPDELLVSERCETPAGGWGIPLEPEPVELAASLTTQVLEAQRKAHWMRLWDESFDHELPLSSVSIEGLRLGSGKMIGFEERRKLGLNWCLHLEVSAASAFAVVTDSPTEEEISAVLDAFHVPKLNVVPGSAYQSLLCGLARSHGEEIGIGFIEDIDFSQQILKLRATAVPPTPVPILKVGSIKVDRAGRELPEPRPWQV